MIPYLKNETHEILGACIEVHKALGKGFSEKVYGEALTYEFCQRHIHFEREKKLQITYKNILLPHYYYADFVLFGSIILEIKAIQQLSNSEIKQTLNYLAASKNKLGLVVNFGTDSLQYRRVIL